MSKHHQYRRYTFIRNAIITGLISGLFWSINNLFYYDAFSNISLINLYPNIKNNTNICSIIFIPLLCSTINDLTAGISISLYNIRNHLTKEFIRTICTKPGKIICIAAIIGGPIGQLSYFIGIALCGPTYSLIITSFYPIIGCLLSTIFLKQKITSHMWLGVFASVLGAIIIGFDSPQFSNSYFYIGILFSIIATVSWALEIILAILGMNLLDPYIAINIRELISGITLFIILIVVSLLYNITSNFSLTLLSNTPPFYLFIAGICAAASYTLWYSTNNKLGCAKGTALNSTFLIWGILIGFAIGSINHITWNLIIGSLLIVSGVFLVLINPKSIF